MNITLFTPYDKQKEFIEEYADTDILFGITVAPRGSGKTLLAMNLMLYWVLKTPEQKGAWFSPVYKQATSVYDQMISASKTLVKYSNRSELSIKFHNGSTVKFLSADSPDSIRGYRFNYVVIDEAAFIKELTIEQAILPTLNPNGKKCLMISTPKGKNHLFKWYNKPEVLSKRFRLKDCPFISKTLVQSAQKSLPPDIFRQEYEADFVDSSNDVFTGVDRVSFIQEYDKPQGQDVYVGIDTGLTGDMSVISLMSPIGRVLGMYSYNNEPLQVISTKISNVMNQYNVVGGYIECNGIGRGMYDLIKPYFRKVKEWYTTQESKQDMVRKLINDIETGTVELPNEDLCPQLHTEFTTYTYKLSNTGKLSFSHIPGGHDDFIDALLMSNYSRNQFMNKKPITISKIQSNNITPTWGQPK